MKTPTLKKLLSHFEKNHTIRLNKYGWTLLKVINFSHSIDSKDDTVAYTLFRPHYEVIKFDSLPDFYKWSKSFKTGLKRKKVFA